MALEASAEFGTSVLLMYFPGNLGVECSCTAVEHFLEHPFFLGSAGSLIPFALATGSTEFHTVGVDPC